MYKQGKYPIVSKKTLAKGIFDIEIYCPHIAKAAKAGQFAQVQADWIATAHTASDNLETLVHRMVRGASLHGLTAIPPRNGRFLRPLLRITREQVETHLAALEQTYVTDSTNLTDDYTRNRIRHHIIPAMQALNPAAERTVSYTLRSLRREDNFLTQQASAAYRCCHTAENTLDGLEQLHPALRFRCIAMLLEECGFSCDAPLLERLERLTRQGGRWNLSGDVYAVGKPGRLTIETCPKRRGILEPVRVQLGENRLDSGWVLAAQLISPEELEKSENVHKKSANELLDYDKIKGSPCVRTRKQGDYLVVNSAGGRKKLNRIFIDEKIPAGLRDQIPVVAAGSEILWIPGGRMNEQYKITSTTGRVLELHYQGGVLT